MSPINYRTGSWIAMTRSSTLVVLPAGTEQSTIDSLWESMLEGPDIERTLRSVTSGFGGDPSRLPGFAIAVLADPLHVIIRGNIRLLCKGPNPVEVSGVWVTTWSEQVLANQNAFEIVMDDETAGAKVLPLLGGIVLASRLDVRLGVETPVSLEQQAPALKEEIPLPEEAPQQAESQLPEKVPPLPEEQPLPEPDGNASEGAATLRPEEPSQTAASPTAMIDSVPWSKDSADPATAGDHDGHTVMSTDLPAFDEDHDGQTVLSSALPAVPPAGTGQEPGTGPADKPGTGPLVVGRMCPQDHANPPTNSRCSICGSPIAAEPDQVRRPSLGRMRISTGDVIELDRSVVIGRQPSASRVRGDGMPRLVQVKSADGDISRSHLEVQLEGWHVMLRDLHSTNGTYLIRPGQAARRLVPGEQTMLLAGDRAEIGDNISVLFEDLQ